MMEIKGIEIYNDREERGWIVGTTEYVNNQSIGKVTHIKDVSTESESGIVDRQYDIFVNGQYYKSLINVPVIVSYT